MLTLEDFAHSILQELFSELPSKFTPVDLIREIHSYVKLSVKVIKLRGNFPKDTQAIDMWRYLKKPHVGKEWELLDQSDFKASAELLLTDDNFLMLNEALQRIRQRAGELSIKWKPTKNTTKNKRQHRYQIPADMMAEITRLARKSLNAEEIAERMNEHPIEEAWDVDVEQVQQALTDARDARGRGRTTTPGKPRPAGSASLKRE